MNRKARVPVKDLPEPAQPGLRPGPVRPSYQFCLPRWYPESDKRLPVGHPGGFGGTKPISARTGAAKGRQDGWRRMHRLNKQTQFATGRSRKTIAKAGGIDDATQWGTNAQNKANLLPSETEGKYFTGKGL